MIYSIAIYAISITWAILHSRHMITLEYNRSASPKYIYEQNEYGIIPSVYLDWFVCGIFLVSPILLLFVILLRVYLYLSRIFKGKTYPEKLNELTPFPFARIKKKRAVFITTPHSPHDVYYCPELNLFEVGCSKFTPEQLRERIIADYYHTPKYIKFALYSKDISSMEAFCTRCAASTENERACCDACIKDLRAESARKRARKRGVGLQLLKLLDKTLKENKK